MRFQSTSRPSLTPLGWRLISLSEQKLYDIDASPVGARESGSALRRGVLVREAVKSAWRSVEDGNKGEMNDWHSTTAMGLDVIGENAEEEEEEGEEQQEERWFEELLSSLGEEEARTSSVTALTTADAQSAEWTVSEVQGVDDELYDYEDMEAYTIPLPPSPTVAPKSPSVAPLSSVMPKITFSPPSPVFDHFVAPSLDEARSAVTVVSVDDLDMEYDSAPSFASYRTSFNAGSPAISTVIPVSAYDRLSTSSPVPSSLDLVFPALSSSVKTVDSNSISSLSTSISAQTDPETPISPITPLDRLITASSTPLPYAFVFGTNGAESPFYLPDLAELEAECEDTDDLFLPPPMHRSYSSTSACSVESLETCDSYDEECDCRTPPLSAADVRHQAERVECEALEFSTSFEKRLQQGVDDVVESYEKWRKQVAGTVCGSSAKRIKSGYRLGEEEDTGRTWVDDEELGLIFG